MRLGLGRWRHLKHHDEGKPKIIKACEAIIWVPGCCKAKLTLAQWAMKSLHHPISWTHFVWCRMKLWPWDQSRIGSQSHWCQDESSSRVKALTELHKRSTLHGERVTSFLKGSTTTRTLYLCLSTVSTPLCCFGPNQAQLHKSCLDWRWPNLSFPTLHQPWNDFEGARS